MSRERLRKDVEIGKTYGVYEVRDLFKKNNRSYYKVVCKAGHEKEVRADYLKKQCEVCYECDLANPLYKSRTYNSWDSMVQRTTSPNNGSYYKYGAVGITCFNEWCEPNGEGFKKFYAYMGGLP